MNAVLETGRPTHRFTRAQYDQMVDAGVFGPEDRLELLDGEIIDMAPQKSRHATAVRLLEEALKAAYGKGFDVRSQLPFLLDDRSEPEPDIAVVSGSPRDYRDAHPSTALLIVEVADSTLAFDRTRKLAAYARAGIPEYWIVDVAHETVEACRNPWNDSYAERRILRAGEQIVPTGSSAPVQVVDLLP
jgi:Uma2 family endonuclease